MIGFISKIKFIEFIGETASSGNGGGGPSTAGQPIGLLLILTKAS